VKIIFRNTAAFGAEVRADLERHHAFAAERVGWLSVGAAKAGRNLVLLPKAYHRVEDEDYVDDPSVGAMMGQEAIRKALEIALLQPVGIFHVHMHGHRGKPSFSPVDLREQLRFVPDFFSVCPKMPHGAIVLSYDRAYGRVWLSEDTIRRISEFNVTGPRLFIDPETEPTGFRFIA
jgi:hypothetical protein